MTEEKSIVKSSANELQTSSSTLIRRGLSLLEKKTKKVLLLEDEETMRYCYRTMLQKQFSEKYALIIFESDGEDALEIFRRENDIDLVISDIRHLKYSGIEHAEMFRKEKADVKIILATASQGGSHIQELISRDVIDGFLSKPVKEKAFVEVVDILLKGDESSNKKKRILLWLSYITHTREIEERTAVQGYK